MSFDAYMMDCFASLNRSNLLFVGAVFAELAGPICKIFTAV